MTTVYICNKVKGHDGPHDQLPGVSIYEMCGKDFASHECRAIRPETLGHQACWRPAGHIGQHKSQDGGNWSADPMETLQRD